MALVGSFFFWMFRIVNLKLQLQRASQPLVFNFLTMFDVPGLLVLWEFSCFNSLSVAR